LKDREPGQANSDAPETQILQNGIPVLTIGRQLVSRARDHHQAPSDRRHSHVALAEPHAQGRLDYSKDDILNYFPGNFFGVYRFNTLADFANGKPASFAQAFPGPGTTGPITHPDLKETGYFVQDEWRVTSQ